MTLCKYYLQGNCRNTASTCRFEHRQPFLGEELPPGVTKSALISNQNSKQISLPQFTEDTVRTDLTTERPLWPFSSYTPGRGDGVALISGRDISPEELRLRAYEYQASGRMQQYEDEVQAMVNEIQNDTSRILNDLKAVVAGLTARNSASTATPQTSVFASKLNPPTISAFGSVGTQSGATPTFGNVSQLSNTSVGQNLSVFGNSSQASPFKKPASFGSTSTPTFGTTSQFGGSTFGSANATSPFSASSQSTAVFGQTSFPAKTSVFSQPTSVFGQTAKPTSVFGSTTSNPGLGQPKSVFGANTTTSSTSSSFGQIAQSQSLFGQPSLPTPVFGQTTQPKSVFAQPNSIANTTAFGAPSTFGSSIQQTSTFGQSSQPASLFGQPKFGQSPETFTTSITKPSLTAPPSVFGSTSAFSVDSSKNSGNLLNQGAPDPPLENELLADILDAFKAAIFVIGRIPEVEPPLSVR